MVVDGGRVAARGFQYQYLKTLESFLDCIDDQRVESVRVEGGGTTTADAVDFDVVNAAGAVIQAVQVKSKAPGDAMSAGEAFCVLCRLIESDAESYQLFANAVAGPGMEVLVCILSTSKDAAELSSRLDDLLRNAPRRRSQLDDLDDARLARLLRAKVVMDGRDEHEIRAGLREKLRTFRNRARAGLGDKSAGFLSGYLISEILRRAADKESAEFTTAQLREILLVPCEDVARSFGFRDWGVVVGSMPQVPDVNRPGLLAQLVSALSTGRNRGVQMAALTGLSGIGKSSLASAYIGDRADNYDVIFWVDAESESALTASFDLAFSELVGADPQTSLHNQSQLRTRVHTELSRLAGRWAMVFDNVTNMRDVSPWIPAGGFGDVIITSTDATARYGDAAVLDVAVMDESEATELAARRLRMTETQTAAREISTLAHEMGHWPLAIELACGYMDSCGIPITQIDVFLQRLKVRSLGDESCLPPGYPRTLEQAVHLCLEQLAQEGRAGGPKERFPLEMLGMASYLASRQVPVHLLAASILIDKKSIDELKLPLQRPIFADPDQWNIAEAVRRLRRFSLVSFDEDIEGVLDGPIPDPVRTIAINSLVQEIVWNACQNTGDFTHGLDRLSLHLELWKTGALHARQFSRAFIMLTHAFTLAQHIIHLRHTSPESMFFIGNLGMMCRNHGKFDTAEFFLRAELEYFAGNNINPVVACQSRVTLTTMYLHRREAVNITEREAVQWMEEVLFYLRSTYEEFPDFTFHMVAGIDSAFDNTSISADHNSLTMLREAFKDLATRIPNTSFAEATAQLNKASRYLDGHLFAEAEEACRVLLERQEVVGVFVSLQVWRLLIEALAKQGKWSEASRELTTLMEEIGAAPLMTDVVSILVHNIGLHCAAFCLKIDNPTDHIALKMLDAMMSWPSIWHAVSTTPSEFAARTRLLDIVLKVLQGKAELAEHQLRSFDVSQLRSQDNLEAHTDTGWEDLWRRVRLECFAQHPFPIA